MVKKNLKRNLYLLTCWLLIENVTLRIDQDTIILNGFIFYNGQFRCFITIYKQTSNKKLFKRTQHVAATKECFTAKQIKYID